MTVDHLLTRTIGRTYHPRVHKKRPREADTSGGTATGR